jgi:hypothetical protein
MAPWRAATALRRAILASFGARARLATVSVRLPIRTRSVLPMRLLQRRPVMCAVCPAPIRSAPLEKLEGDPLCSSE